MDDIAQAQLDMWNIDIATPTKPKAIMIQDQMAQDKNNEHSLHQHIAWYIQYQKGFIFISNYMYISFIRCPNREELILI